MQMIHGPQEALLNARNVAIDRCFRGDYMGEKTIKRPRTFEMNEYPEHSSVWDRDENISSSIDGGEDFIHIRQFRVTDKSKDDWETEEILEVFLTRKEFEQLQNIINDFYNWHIRMRDMKDVRLRFVNPNETHN